MASLKDRSVGRKDLFMFDPRQLREDPGWNARHDTPELREHLDTLKGSIRSLGVLEPLTCYVSGEDLIVTNGHCRLKATMELIAEGVEIVSVPVRVEDKGTNEADRALSMLSRNSGKPLTTLETAEVVKRLMGYGWDEAKIKAKTGFSGTYIGRLLTLLESPEPIRAAVDRGEVSASLAVEVQKSNPADAHAVLQEAGEIAKAAGAPRTMPKHVQAAQEAREEAKEPVPEGQAPAPAKKTLRGWPDDAKALAKEVKAFVNATNLEKAAKRLCDYYEANLGA